MVHQVLNVSSKGTKIYVLLFDDVEHKISCNCPGWIYPRGGRSRGCKHTKAYIAEMGLLEVVQE